MSLSSSLNAGVAGLAVNSSRLAALSDNIANSQTNGYKRADVEFSALVTASNGGAYTAGGVAGESFRNIAGNGSPITTSSSTDILVTGRGFLPVTTIGAVDREANERPFQMITTGSFEVNADGYLTTRSGLALTGWEVDADGTLLNAVSRSGPADLVPVRPSNFALAAASTTEIGLNVNLPASATEVGATGTPFTVPIEYFDAIGRSNDLSVLYTPTVGSGDEWTVSFFDSATSAVTPVAEYTVVFDTTRAGRGGILSVTPIGAAIYDATTGIAEITVADGPIEVSIGATGLEGGLTQLAAPFSATNVTKNGSAAGQLASLAFTEAGLLEAVYDTGQRRFIYQVPIADVPNQNGLTALDNQAFSISSASGPLFLYDANTGPVGSIEGFALEQSTVDVGKELTDLIVTQRAYSSNATVIRTVDEMLAETTNLKR